jgi:hypothetical protein
MYHCSLSKFFNACSRVYTHVCVLSTRNTLPRLGFWKPNICLIGVFYECWPVLEATCMDLLCACMNNVCMYVDQHCLCEDVSTHIYIYVYIYVYIRIYVRKCLLSFWELLYLYISLPHFSYHWPHILYDWISVIYNTHTKLKCTANLKIIDARYQLSAVFSTSFLPENRCVHDNGRQLFWDWQ